MRRVGREEGRCSCYSRAGGGAWREGWREGGVIQREEREKGGGKRTVELRR